MPEKFPRADLNIYLAKPEVKIPSDIVKNLDALKAFDLEVLGISPCNLFIKNNYLNIPRWAKFFSTKVSPTEFGKNSSAGALVFAKVDDSILLLTFGQGHHLVDSAKIEMNFGLRTALNLLDVASLRSIDKSSFEQHPTQTREQTGIATELQYFGLNIERDLLRAITGKPNDEQFGTRISGMDALKLSVEVNLNNLSDLLKRILVAYKDNAYKKGAFGWVDHIGEVKDKSVHELLDGKLLDRITSGNFERLWLSVPEIIDWDRVVGFKYSRGASSPRFYDIRMADFLETLDNIGIDIEKIRQRKIFCVDSEDCVVYERPAYRFIYAEVNHQSCVYVLNNGKWYKINRKFAKQVNHFFENVPKYSETLPNFNDETEGDYNERVAKSDPDSFCLLDKKNIRILGAASPVEPCDLLRNGREFIHVKRYGGSSVLSHLFNQGLVSGELFQMEAEFRQLLNSKLPLTFKLANPEIRPHLNEYLVVFAIISESDEKDLSIPFFSRISLRHVITRLQAIGFEVAVAKISVNEFKKNTKNYGPNKKQI
ncbi:MAG: TIGR04141 family sporadically distributed protein [Nitrospirales bacterium]